MLVQREKEFLHDQHKLKQDLELLIAAEAHVVSPTPKDLLTMEATKGFFRYDTFAADFALASKCMPLFIFGLDKLVRGGLRVGDVDF